MIDPGNVGNLGALIARLTYWVLGFAGALFVLFIIWSGILFVTSTGNKDRVARARRTLTYSIIGLVIIIIMLLIIPIIIDSLAAAGLQ